jgi:hypothetical protein
LHAGPLSSLSKNLTFKHKWDICSSLTIKLVFKQFLTSSKNTFLRLVEINNDKIILGRTVCIFSGGGLTVRGQKGLAGGEPSG